MAIIIAEYVTRLHTRGFGSAIIRALPCKAIQVQGNPEKRRIEMLSKRLAAIDKSRCVACGACTKVCPRSALSIFRGCYAQVDEALCVGCGRCAGVCPMGSINIKERVQA